MINFPEKFVLTALVMAGGLLAIAPTHTEAAWSGAVGGSQSAPRAPARLLRPLATEIIGQSQTEMWWPYSTLAGWQARIKIGSGYMDWSNPAFVIWSVAPVAGVDGVTRAYDGIQRVVITIGREPRDGTGTYESKLDATIATVRTKYPKLREIRLQALAAGPNEGLCYVDQVTASGAVRSTVVRTTQNLQDITLAISALTKKYADVKAGPVLLVDDCSEFADSAGHLTDAGRADIGAKMDKFYYGL